MKKTNIVRSVAIVLSLGVAPGIAFAQGDMTKKPEGQSQSTTSGGGQGETSTHSTMSGQADAGQKAQADSSMQGDNSSSKQNAQADQNSSSKSAQDENGSMKHSKHAKGENGSSMKNAQGENSSSTKNAQGETSSHNKNAQGESHSMQKNAQTQNSNENGQNAKNESGHTGNMNASGQSTSNEKTSSIHVNVSDHQRTEIHQIITETHVEPVEHPSFSVTVGTAVPHRVHLHRLPPRVVEIVPEYKDYEYFVLADGRIVIVDPDTLEIVYILSA